VPPIRMSSAGVLANRKPPPSSVQEVPCTARGECVVLVTGECTRDNRLLFKKLFIFSEKSQIFAFYHAYFQTMVGDSIANIRMYSDSSEDENSSAHEEVPLMANDPPYDPRFVDLHLKMLVIS
jgi:hypothetical protein